MNIQEEKRVCFDVDQNKQKINYLLKKNKENETQQTELNQKLATAQSDINSLSSAVETLQNANTGEEKIQLLSYDIVKIVDNTYCDVYWEPMPIYFFAEKGSKVKGREQPQQGSCWLSSLHLISREHFAPLNLNI